MANITILVADYNNIQKKIAAVMGPGGTDPVTNTADDTFGYNQSVVSSSQLSNSPTRTAISVASWSALRNDIIRARQHQTGVSIGARGTKDPLYVAGSNLLLPTAKYLITDADRAAYMAMVDTVIANRLVRPPATQATSTVLSQSVYSDPWNTTIVNTVTVSFSSANDAKYFFNTGGAIDVSATRTGGTTNDKNTSWTNLLIAVGKVSVGANSTYTTGTGTVNSAVGYRQLTTYDQLIYTISSTTTNYTDNRYTINARRGSSGNVIIFTIKFEDLSTYTNDAKVDGSKNSIVSVYRAGGTNVTSSATPTLQSSVFTSLDNHLPGGTLAITGNSVVNSTLSLVNNLSDADGLGPFFYQWRRNTTIISGATNATYTTTSLDIGKTVTCTVSYLDLLGNSESVTTDQGVLVTAVPNTAPTGTVAISGSEIVGNTLSVSGTLNDADGMGTLRFQWKREGFDIYGEISSTYDTVAIDVGKRISCTVSFTDGLGKIESATTASKLITAVPDTSGSGSVLIMGAASQQAGSILAANISALTDPDGIKTLAYEWRTSSGKVTGSTNSITYTTVKADVGSEIYCVVTVTDNLGYTKTVQSTNSITITANPALVQQAATGNLTISGSLIVDNVLTLNGLSTIADVNGIPGSINKQWQKKVGSGAFANIPSATAITYRTVLADVGASIRCIASFTDSLGTQESIVSNTVVVLPVPAVVNNLHTGKVTISSISGNTIVGCELEVSTYALKDDDGIDNTSYLYQWFNGTDEIPGATGTSYITITSDIGASITCKVTYTDNAEFTETVPSNAIIIQAGDNNVHTGSVSITGNTVVGSVLTATNNIADADGLGTFTYTWNRDGLPISGASGLTRTTYTTVSADVGKAITCTITYTDGTTHNETAISNPITVTQLADHAGVIVVTGSLYAGFPISATVTDADTISGNIIWTWTAQSGASTGSKTESKSTSEASTFTPAGSGNMIVTATYNDSLRNNVVATLSITVAGPAVYTAPSTTSEYYTFTVPQGVTKLALEVAGGGGGGGGWDSKAGGAGQSGEKVITTITGLTPGEVLKVYVGAGGVGGTTRYGGITIYRVPLASAFSNVPVIINYENIIAKNPPSNPPMVMQTYAWTSPLMRKMSFWNKITSHSVASGGTVEWPNIPFTTYRRMWCLISGMADDGATISIDGQLLLSPGSYAGTWSIFTQLNPGNHLLSVTGNNTNNLTPAGVVVELVESSTGFVDGGRGGYAGGSGQSGNGGSGGGASAIVRSNGEILVVGGGGGGGGGGGKDGGGTATPSLSHLNSTANGLDLSGDGAGGGGGGGGYDTISVVGKILGQGKGSSSAGENGAWAGVSGTSYVKSGLTATFASAQNNGLSSTSAVTGDGKSGSVKITAVP